MTPALAVRAAGSLLDVTVDLDPSDYAAQLGDERTRLERFGTEGVDVSVEASFNLSYARLSPDGRTLAFNSRKGGPVNTWVVALEGGEPRQLTFDKEMMGFPCWSPDGRWLAVEVKRGEETQIALMPSGGGDPVQLTS